MGLACLLCASVALAQPAASDAWLSYRAEPAEGCPDIAQVRALIDARLAGKAPRGTARISIGARPDGQFDAALLLTDPEGASSERRLSAPSCAQAAEAAALVTAVFASVKDVPAPSPAAPPPSQVALETPAPTSHMSLALGLRAGARTALADPVAAFASANLELSWLRAGTFAPSLRASAGYAHGRAGPAAARISLRSGMTALDLMPLRVALGARWELRPYAHVEAGRQWAAWQDGPRGTRTGPWLAIGAGLRLSAKVGGCVSADLESSAAYIAVRNRFLETQQVVHRVPHLGVGATLGLRCALW